MSTTVGKLRWKSPIDSSTLRATKIYGLSTWTANYLSLGTASLHNWDFWFHIDKKKTSVVVYLKEADRESAIQFEKSSRLKNWRFYKDIWGFTVGRKLRVVQTIDEWGDETPVSKQIELGDLLLAIDGQKFGLDGPPYPTSDRPVDFLFQRPNGTTYDAVLKKSVVTYDSDAE